MNLTNAREEEIKNRVAKEFFFNYDCTKIIGNIDFCVCEKPEKEQLDIFEQELLKNFVWAEAKRGSKQDIYASFVQLILTIGKAKTFNKFSPPLFLAAFDAEKIAFLRWDKIQHIFSTNDFNWNITSSDHDNPHFKMLYSLIQDNLEKDSLLFYYAQDERELREFIEDNFKEGNLLDRKILIDKNNFYFIYQKWLERVKPTISISWSDAKTMEILDVDFYLADLISDKDNSLLENLKVVLQHNKYKLKVGSNILGGLFQEHGFMDDQRAYKRFWNIYERPPKKEYWDYIIDRRDILVPQDFRERKGAFYTPQMWVELSQNYLARVLGEDWQEEYYIWDCAAGTGNLLNGLTEKYRIYASTLDSADVDVMKEKIKSGTSNLLEDHVFTFDFLNGDFSNLPSSLQDIINDKEKRKKLVIYINPPYAEATTAKTVAKTGSNKSKVATDNRTYRRYKKDLGKASNELFAQFLIRIYKEIPNCKIANFSTLKPLQSTNFEDFRNIFQAKLETLFIIPSKSFDNVSGNFPIGFFIWSTNIKRVFKTIQADVYNIRGKGRGYKKIYTKKDAKYINEWLQLLQEDSDAIGILDVRGNDFQNSKYCCIQKPNFERTSHSTLIPITAINVYPICIYFSARLCIEATWLNDRDQFLYPNNKWKKDKEFQRDCLIFTLFHGKNRVTSKDDINYWIPFAEKEVRPKERYKSHFMIDFLNGKIKPSKEKQTSIAEKEKNEIDLSSEPIIDNLSTEAKAVYTAGKELWKYYHSKKDSNPDASYYDIREYFQGRGKNGRMNNSSSDEKYNDLISDLREKQKDLADKIAKKVYEYGFLV